MFRTRAFTAKKWKVAKIGFSYLSRMTLKAVLGVLAGYALARASRALNFRREAAEGSTSLEERTTLTLSRKQPTSVLISTRSAFQCFGNCVRCIEEKISSSSAMHHNRWCTEWNSGLQWREIVSAAECRQRRRRPKAQQWCRVLLVQSILV